MTSNAQQNQTEGSSKIPLKTILGRRHSIEQADQAIKTFLSFIQAQQASEISYGAKSGGCIISHSSFRERWLKVKWVLAGERNPFLWDGELLSIGLEGVSKPRIFAHFDWDAIGICYRALVMGVTRGIISKAHHLDHVPALGAQWWEHLADAMAKVQGTQTDRVYIVEDRIAGQLSSRFGLKLRRPFPSWQTAHGDLHWANLSAPDFTIIDWETWGRAPYAFDIARLHSLAVKQADVVGRLKEVFSATMAKPEYDVTFLYAAAELMRSFDIRGRHEEIQGDLRQEVENVLNAGRYAAFCE